MAGSFRLNSLYMGNNKFNNRMERKQHQSSSRIIHLAYPNDRNNPYKRIIKMAETKFVALILNLIGVPLCFIAFWDNIDNVKSAVIFIVALTFLMIRIYFYVIWAKQKTEKQKLENDRMKMENNKFERDNDK